MIPRTLAPAVGIGATIVAIGLAAAQVLAQGTSIELDAPPTNGTFTWIDVEGEASYRAFGHVSYLPPPSCTNMLNTPGEGVEFDEELPADATSFTLPVPQDPRLTWRKDLQFTIEALDASGERIARNGFASTADQFCTPEQIAEELAAAGTGFEPEGWPIPKLVALLGAAGAGLAAGGWLLRRRDS